jgi:MerR family transcriptional regulator, copper efflux regulator
LLESVFMRISEAARRLGTSARMLRYREDLGLLPQVRDPLAGPPWSSRGPSRGPSSGAPRGPSSGPSNGPSRGLSSGAPRGPSSGSSSGAPRGPSHRQFSEADLEAVAAALELERRYDISPASLAFGLRVLAEPAVRVAVADLGRRLGRIPATPGRALDFEKERALRLLSRG